MKKEAVQAAKEVSIVSVLAAAMFLVCAVQDGCIWAIIALTAYISIWLTVNLQKKKEPRSKSRETNKSITNTTINFKETQLLKPYVIRDMREI